MKRIIIISISLLIMTGCQNMAVKIRGKVVSEKLINPNIRHRSSPVEIRIYHLKGEKRFEAASYFSLLRRDRKYLGYDLLHKETMIVRPGQNIPYKTDAHKDTKYIGVFAAFRVRKGTYWKMIKRTSPFKHEYITITVSKHRIMVNNK